MNSFKIALHHLIAKPLSTALSTLLMALGIAIVSLLLLLGQQLEEKFKNNLRGIDMVLGAKGSPLQLILSAVYQIDAPVGNISLAEARQSTQNPLVKMAIPISMGDNYQGYRIVGSTAQYVTHLQGRMAEGRLFGQAMECVIGAQVAQTTGLRVGDSFDGAHGLDGEGEVHKGSAYRVVGILAANNSVLDRVVVTPLESIWAVHEHSEEPQNVIESLGAPHDEADHDHTEAADDKREITAMLVQFRNPMALMVLPRNINSNTKLQAALPSIEINRLFDLLGLGLSTLQAIAWVIMVVSGLSMFVALYNSLKERRYEMALMLSMGATRIKLFGMLLLEGLLIAVAGFLAGMLISRAALGYMAGWATQDFRYDFEVWTLLPAEWVLLAGALLIGFLAAALPALQIYRVNISKTLADG
jgi:putative ABC transport system permease protein